MVPRGRRYLLGSNCSARQVPVMRISAPPLFVLQVEKWHNLNPYHRSLALIACPLLAAAMSPRQQHVADTEEATPCLTSDTNVYSVTWAVIPQQPYKSYGPTTRTLVTGAFPSIKISVAVRDALVPEVLAKVLLDPLHSAFDSPVRKRTSKLTIRFVVSGSEAV